jgi:hypothetical protein
MFSKAHCSRLRSDEGQHYLITPAAALTSGPNNSTRRAPIYCRRKTRSSQVWGAHSSFNSPIPEGAPVIRMLVANRDAKDLALQNSRCVSIAKRNRSPFKQPGSVHLDS